ncbi:unnamed protein product [Dicrocoelium dendriticum]|nr:unnamed protein product [Dicrocoelium dendriticum]
MSEADIDPEGRQAENWEASVNQIEGLFCATVNAGSLITADFDYTAAPIYSLIDQLPDVESRHKLTNLLTRCLNDRAHYESLYTKAELEAHNARERLQRLEMELEDLRSATALMVAGQDDAFYNLKRRYDEEIASLQSISMQEVAEIQAASHRALEEERTRWAAERDALLAHLNAQQNTHPSEKSRPVSTYQSDRSGTQNLTTHALEMVEKLTRRVKGLTGGEMNTSNNGLSNDFGVDPMPSSYPDHGKETYIERYEKEIARLRGMLEDFMIQNETGLHDEGEALGVSSQAVITPCDLSVSEQATVPNIAEKAVCDVDDIASKSSPITEVSWIHLQSTTRGDPKRSSIECAMCSNYEQRLQNLQTDRLQSEKKLITLSEELAVKSSECAQAVRHSVDLEEQLKVCAEKHAKRIEQLDATLVRLSERLDVLLVNSKSYQQFTENELSRLADERQTLVADFQLLQSHYDALLDRRSRAALELSEQPIQLPSDKADLELLALRLYEENWSIRAARDHLDDLMKSDSQFLRHQISAERQERADLEKSHQRELDEVNARLASLSDIVQQRDREVAARDKLQHEVAQLNAELAEVRSKLSVSEMEATEARAEVTTLQQRLVCLQTDLDNVESVQADFVRLSQNLQIQLERLRQQDHEVRWIDPEDITTCSACDTIFPSGSAGISQKANCRHCGKVYCPNCLQNTAPSGPTGRPARVCDFCHTLLNKHVAPYFSTGFHRDSSIGTQSLTRSPRSSMYASNLHSPKQSSCVNKPADSPTSDNT